MILSRKSKGHAARRNSGHPFLQKVVLARYDTENGELIRGIPTDLMQQKVTAL
ncbi:hypothetical protein CIPAW_02G117400 [Carya illinoinensis]|uniref:Uncharacterized protein n=1 Tax=Carya illinoinensis TaxID=32201 RepID=A0A8T1RD43_CARIL|nr:hypothetical protein CIPAW_02G117400 [Carya illinoinensis]KAG6664786.1 hypothetical protein CIPAW_02G117400 [Carya illinoinensis]